MPCARPNGCIASSCNNGAIRALHLVAPPDASGLPPAPRFGPDCTSPVPLHRTVTRPLSGARYALRMQAPGTPHGNAAIAWMYPCRFCVLLLLLFSTPHSVSYHAPCRRRRMTTRRNRAATLGNPQTDRLLATHLSMSRGRLPFVAPQIANMCSARPRSRGTAAAIKETTGPLNGHGGAASVRHRRQAPTRS